jgi:predicted metal-binding membrane protein
MRRSRLLVFALVVLAAAAGWGWLIAMTAAMLPMTDMTTLGPGMGVLNFFNQFSGLSEELRKALAVICAPTSGHFGMPSGAIWSFSDLGLVFLMWQAMVLAMMLPSALPVLSLEAERSAGRVLPPVLLVAGYLTVWTGFSIAAAVLQEGLTAARLLNPVMGPASQVLSGTTLLAVAVYQLTPLKLGCLTRCRIPAPLFLSPEAPPRRWYGAGLIAGLDCLGCCWALMAAMFAVGVMNVVWVALLGILMIWEKLTSGMLATRVIAGVAGLWGLVLIALSPQGLKLLGL